MTDQTNETAARRQRSRAPWRELAALALYGLLLLLYRPLDPFEWDEVLFQRALDHYDVASHSPHPPGYPLYVGLAKAVRLVVGDPQLALQLVGIASTLAALVLTWLLARRLGGTRGAATLAAATLAAVPGFVFNGNIGMSDVPGVAAGVGVALLFTLAWERPALLVAGALAAGAASGIRVANLIVAVPFAFVAIAAAWRRSAWRWLLLAPVAFAAAAAAVWVPAILLTGPARFLGAVRQQSDYIERTWGGLRLPGAPLHEAIAFWGARWLGPTALVVVLWVVILIGALAWWRSGRRRLVVVTALGGASFLVFAAFALEYKVAMRYALPAAPFLALLAAGVTAVRRRPLRLLAESALLVWVCGTAIWVAPSLPIRRRPAPVWQALSFVRASFDPVTTKVMIDGVIGPHARYVLERAGFRVEAPRSSTLAALAATAGPEVVFVAPRPIPGTEVLFQADWGSDLVMRLTRNRYGSCAVCRQRESPPGPEVSQGLTVGPDSWRLSGAGSIRLPASSRPAMLLLEPRTLPVIVRRPGLPAATLQPGKTMAAILMPGPTGEIRLLAPPGSSAELAPIELFDVNPATSAPGLAAAFVVPQVAHTDGVSGSRWRTDLFVYNPNAFGIGVTLIFLPTGQANSQVRAADIKLAPGESTRVPDVVALPALDGPVRSGALVLAAAPAVDRGPERALFVASSRTYNLRAADTGGNPGECLPAVPLDEGLCLGGRATFRGVTANEKLRANLGVVALSRTGVTVHVAARDRSAKARVDSDWQIAPFGHLQKKLPEGLLDGTVEVVVVAAPPDARVFAYLSQIDDNSGAPVHSLPEVTRDCPAGSQPAPLPARQPAARPPT